MLILELACTQYVTLKMAYSIHHLLLEGRCRGCDASATEGHCRKPELFTPLAALGLGFSTLHHDDGSFDDNNNRHQHSM